MSELLEEWKASSVQRELVTPDGTFPRPVKNSAQSPPHKRPSVSGRLKIEAPKPQHAQKPDWLFRKIVGPLLWAKGDFSPRTPP